MRRLSAMLLLCATLAPAQELAHRGWRGNGIAPEAWYHHATFVRFNADTTYGNANKQLENINSIGADTVILPDPEPVPNAPLPFADRFGTEDELDALLREASARRMHVLLRVPLNRITANPGELRFWMNRGIAGLDVGTVTAADADSLRLLRASLDRYPGQRILLARTPATPASIPLASARRNSRRAAPTDPVTLHVLSAEDAESAHASSANSASQLIEITAEPPAAATPAEGVVAVGALPALRSLVPLLLAPGAPILDIRLLATESDRTALQQALTTRSTHAALRSGTVTAVSDAPTGLRAWVLQSSRSSRQGSLLLAENTTSSTIMLQLSSTLAKQGVRAGFLQPILRSDGAMGSLDLNTGTLPAGAAVLGEIGGVAATAPASDAPPQGTRHRRRRR